jgi:hypothetical protein
MMKFIVVSLFLDHARKIPAWKSVGDGVLISDIRSKELVMEVNEGMTLRILSLL